MDRICHEEFDAQKLVSEFPAQLHDRNKEIVFELSSPPGAIHSGAVSFSRWRQLPLPKSVTRSETHPRFELREDHFTYGESPYGHIDWHLNFAHYDLFCAYGSSLFAQDEMQVAEHPALASLRHALVAAGIEPLTVKDDIATPALIMGVERRCQVSTDANSDAERPHGLYGNRFSSASEDAIRRAVEVIEPPTTSNILAMEAPTGGAGRYALPDFEFVLATALTGFSAAVSESQRAISADLQTTIHTGYWGCGAYGGNRELMPLLQMIAACESKLDTLVFHSGADNAGYDRASDLLDELLPVNQEISLNTLLSRIDSIGFEWGVSDGN